MDQKTKQIEAQIDSYHAELKQWESKIDQLDASERIEFEQSRDKFTSELAEAWQDLTEAKVDEYGAHLEELFHDMKARWHGQFAD